MLTIIPKLDKEWSVSFDFKSTGTNNVTSNVLHLTTGNNNKEYGSRIATVWSFTSSTKLFIESPINGNKNFRTTTDILPANTWVTIQIRNMLVGGKYIYKVAIDGRKYVELINNQAEEFHTVKVYAGDPWFSAHTGYIRNLDIRTAGVC